MSSIENRMLKRTRNNRHWRYALMLLLLTVGCSGISPIYSVGGGAGTYVVRKGDSLYSIAFRYGLDYKSLARINRVSPPYTIYVNQVLQLRGSEKLPKKDGGPSKTKLLMKPRVSKLIKHQSRSEEVTNWIWPLKGQIINKFSLVHPVNKGIDIAGKSGDSVVAAAGGLVVYAGGNLRGYGQLVIVKHNNSFLSAYGNNQSLLVSEGERVAKGKVIAHVGKNAMNLEMLHFEIRRDGKPVNPLNYIKK